MKSLINFIQDEVSELLHNFYNLNTEGAQINVTNTAAPHEGDYSLVTFSYAKQLRENPEKIGQRLGLALQEKHPHIFISFNVIKGFLNLIIADSFWIGFLKQTTLDQKFNLANEKECTYMVEYSSPNTNKPLHLGHLRNNFLGQTITNLLKATGNKVVTTCVVNDRGIHICKSMLAWMDYGSGTTPMQSHKKGDHFVGDYYVQFNKQLQAEKKELMNKGYSADEAEEFAPSMQAAKNLLLQWEQKDPKTLEIWRQLNNWVYQGFDETYKKIGTCFDKIYFESETYLLGKSLVQEGVNKKIFFIKDDKSIWVDLTAEGLDEKLLIRKDGTSVYITQDIGLAQKRYQDFPTDKSIYVIGDEQNYHLQVLQLICRKLDLPVAQGIEHLSYGMVELPFGRMKSREGTVVDADDIIAEMITVAEQKTKELGKTNEFSSEELKKLHEIIGMGALRFFLLRVDAKKRIIFNPEESIDFNGFSASFIQYTYARIQSILRKAQEHNLHKQPFMQTEPLSTVERNICLLLEQFVSIVQGARESYSPSILCTYLFTVAKSFNSFYAEVPILQASTIESKTIRLAICSITSVAIAQGMGILGIDVPSRM
ncbi:MAG: arginine--tRNA ligase [Phycisphaerales bacterium]|nr:arginine--tRNA ligase [Phycisphaerales bacterium]